MAKELLKTAQVCFLEKKLIWLFLILIKFELILVSVEQAGTSLAMLVFGEMLPRYWWLWGVESFSEVIQSFACCNNIWMVDLSLHMWIWHCWDRFFRCMFMCLNKNPFTGLLWSLNKTLVLRNDTPSHRRIGNGNRKPAKYTIEWSFKYLNGWF